MKTKQISILLLSCDSYSDLWNDFFNLKERFWPDCEYQWYIVTETSDFYRTNVEVIKCGKELNWAGRLRYAINAVNTPYIGIFLDDYFITAPINNKRIKSYVELMIKEKVSFLNLSNVFHHITDLPNKEYYSDHLIVIPKHLKYGIDTSAAIWDRDFLLEKLGYEDYNAWQFEVDRCEEAASENGLEGIILCDDLLSFNVSEIPVVIQGTLYPEAITYFAKKIGYNIQTSRKRMTYINVLKYKLKVKASRVKHCRRLLKWIGSHLLGYKFFTHN